MSQICSFVTALMVALACTTVYQLWARRSHIIRDDLRDEERALAWRVVIFLVLPILILVDMRATIVAAEYCGGWIKDLVWGGWWFKALPQELSSADCLLPVLFAGVAAQFLLALCLVPSLFFRPHPFVATVITYTISTIFAANLLIDPIAAMVGAGSFRWDLALGSAPHDQVLVLLAIYTLLTVVLFGCFRNRAIRLWFAELSCPHVGEQLRIALSESKAQPENEFQGARLTVLLERAGLRRQAGRELKRLKRLSPQSIYALFLDGYLAFKNRRYRKSQLAFEKAAETIVLDDNLRASFLAASACAAFSAGDYQGALNFSDRALEFDHMCIVARLVKVDVFLRTGKKEQAGDEVLAAIGCGLDLDMEGKLPVDADLVLRSLARLERLPASASREKTAAGV